MIVDNVERTRPVIVPDNVIAEINKLKYYFLNLTAHWHPSFNPFYDRHHHIVLPVSADASDDHLLLKDLWRRTTITGAKVEAGYFLITGKIESVTDKFVGLVTPKIGMDDDIGFYDECMTVLDGIAKAIADYLKKGVISLEEYKDKMPAQVTAGKTTEEITEMVINSLQEKGAIIMMDAVSGRELDGGESVDSVVVKSGSIDAGNLPEGSFEEDPEFDESAEVPGISGQEEDPDFKDPQFDDEKVDPFGPPAAAIPTDGDAPIPQGDISMYERTENMGMAGIDAEEEADW